MFKRATKKDAKLRLALIGPSGSGKTYSALAIGSGLGARIALIDSERKSASKYSDKFLFDVHELEDFHPQKYIDAIESAGAGGYDTVIVDSLSHAWMGKGGTLELVEQTKKRAQGREGNSFTAWRDVTPLHNALVDALLSCPAHVIVTMRSKMAYVLEEYDDAGRKRTRVNKLGMQPVQRDGLEYEFDVIADMDLDNNLMVSKTRIDAMRQMVVQCPGKKLGLSMAQWLEGDGSSVEGDARPAPTGAAAAPLMPEDSEIRARMHAAVDTLGTARCTDIRAGRSLRTKGQRMMMLLELEREVARGADSRAENVR